MAAQPDRRSTVAVARPRGRRRCQGGHRGVRQWCGACGGEAGGGRWPETVQEVDRWLPEPFQWPSGVGSRNGGRGIEGVLERQWRRSPGTAVAASKMSRHGGGSGEGVLAAAVCERNKNWEVIQAESRVLNL
jgi:hypothetical protein